MESHLKAVKLWVGGRQPTKLELQDFVRELMEDVGVEKVGFATAAAVRAFPDVARAISESGLELDEVLIVF